MPGSIFLLKDGTYAWSGLAAAVQKQSANILPDIYLTPFGQARSKKWSTVQLDGQVDLVVFGCLSSGPDQAAQGFRARYAATDHTDEKGGRFLLYVPQQAEGANQLATAYRSMEHAPLSTAPISWRK